MNSILAGIVNLETQGSMTIVSLAAEGGLSLRAIVVETPETAAYLRLENSLQALFKETELIIAPAEFSTLSIDNQWASHIITIDKGALLSRIKLLTSAGAMVSLISTRSLKRLNLKAGMEVTAMVGMTSIILTP